MPRIPKPFFWRGGWYTDFGGQRQLLAKGEHNKSAADDALLRLRHQDLLADGKTFPEDGSGAVEIMVKHASVTASGDRLLISLQVHAKEKESFFKLGGDATVHIWGRPMIDQMQQTAKAVVLFEVRTFEPPMREMGTLLVECANLVGRAVPLLQSIGDNVSMLTAITEELTKLEGRVDDLQDIGMKELFLKHRDANTMDFIVGAEIYDHLEKVADRFDDVANEINSIVIEQV